MPLAADASPPEGAEAEVAPAEVAEANGGENATVSAEKGPQLRRIPVPGTDKAILVPKRRANKVVRTTPTIWMEVHRPSPPKDTGQERDSAREEEISRGTNQKKPDRRRDGRSHLPDLARILYRPWLFHGTPVWEKLQGR